MRQTYDQILGFSGGGYGSVFSINLDVGPTYREIVLTTTNLNTDQLTKILVTLNGDDIVNVTGAELKMLEAYKQNPDGTGKFVIPFSDNAVITPESQNLTELVTMEGDNLTLQVFTGAATSGQTSAGSVPALVGLAVLTSGLEVGAGGVLVKKMRKTIPRLYSELIPAGSTGKNVYKNFNRGPRIRRMHMGNGTTTTVTNLEIKRDKLTLVDDLSKADNDFLLKRELLTPQAGYFHFDPMMSGFALYDFLQTAGQSFEINPTVSSSGDIKVLWETVETV